ncbi:hypothetical protein VDGD_21534 [Verticillium dahliae]|nr:hypothetical protein VDGD_21534 [Verticillium dahliae]
MAMQAQHGPPGPPPPPGPPQQGQGFAPSRQASFVIEAMWIQVGTCCEVLGDLDEAILAYEAALRANPQSILAMNAISLILRTREHFAKAVEYLQAVLKIDAHNGEAWGSLGTQIPNLDALSPSAY